MWAVGKALGEWHSCGTAAIYNFQYMETLWSCWQAPAQGKVRTAQADTGSGQVGSGVIPVLAQWYLGDLQQAVCELRYDSARKGDTPEFNLKWERTLQSFVQSSTGHAAACSWCLWHPVYPECTDAPKAIPGVSEGSPKLGGNLKTDLSRTRRSCVHKSTVVRSRPISCNVLSTIVAFSKY